MELDQAIKERRSVRRFKKLDVPWYLVVECLEAAVHAPSSGNAQNWRFIVVRNSETREKVVKACDEQYWMLKAPVLIVICSDLTKVRRLFGVRGEALYAVQNCAAAMENLLLKASELGLGATWIGAFDETKLNELLKIDGDVRPQAIFALGYADEYEEKSKREPLENVVFFEEYGKKEDKIRGKLTPITDMLKKGFGKIIEKGKRH